MSMWPACGLAISVMLVGAACSGGGDGGGATQTVAPATLPVALQRAFPALVFSAPLGLLQAPADATRWYVIEQGGTVRSFANDPAVATSSVYVNLGGAVTSGGETGLLGMAFHPNFPADPRIYLSYTATVGAQLVSRLSVFQTTNSGQTFLPASEIILLAVNQPESNHNGGHILFGPDGYLYMGLGDGGGNGDVHGTIGNGQNINTVLGKILRINVNAPQSPYGIPAGNPFAANPLCNTGGTGTTPCPEIYAYGLRNPWRFSFDRDTAMLWIADVGQNAWEEIDRIGSAGVNLGWRCREGAHAFNASCGAATNLVEPVAEYDHSVGQSITGGFVYRGSAYPTLQGNYVFGDFISGRLFFIAGNTPSSSTLSVTAGAITGRSIAAFGEGTDRELYAVDYAGGGIYRVISP